MTSIRVARRRRRRGHSTAVAARGDRRGQSLFGHVAEPLAQTASRLARAGVWSAAAAAISPPLVRDRDVTDRSDLAPRRRRCRSPGDAEVVRARHATAGRRPAGNSLLSSISRRTLPGRDWTGVVAERFGHWAAGLSRRRASAVGRTGATDAPGQRGARRHARPDARDPRADRLRRFVAAMPDTADAAIDGRWPRLAYRMRHSKPIFTGCCILAAGHRPRGSGSGSPSKRAGDDSSLTAFLAIRLMWEEALFVHCGDILSLVAQQALTRLRDAAPLSPTERSRRGDRPGRRRTGGAEATCYRPWRASRRAATQAANPGGVLHRRALGGFPTRARSCRSDGRHNRFRWLFRPWSRRYRRGVRRCRGAAAGAADAEPITRAPRRTLRPTRGARLAARRHGHGTASSLLRCRRSPSSRRPARHTSSSWSAMRSRIGHAPRQSRRRWPSRRSPIDAASLPPRPCCGRCR